MTQQCFIIGDSHVDAIKDALAHGHQGPIRFQAYRLAKLKNGRPAGDIAPDEAKRRIHMLEGNSLVVCAMGGNQHSALSLVQHPRPFDFAFPGEPFQARADVEIIPFQAVRMQLHEGIKPDFLHVRTLLDATKGRLIHLAPPPPKADEAHILRSIETYFMERGLTRYGVTDAHLRLKVWRVQIMILRQLCAEAGVVFLPNPPETLTNDGFLAKEFYADDATHANGRYGERVLRQIEALCAENAAGRDVPDSSPGD